MGATPSNESRSDIRPDQIKLKELSPSAVQKIKQRFQKNPDTVKLTKKNLMTEFNIGQREADILFDYFDMDGDSQIDNYEFTCAMAMLVHSSVELRSEFLFKLYDFDSNSYLTRDEIGYLVQNMTLSRGRPLIKNEIETKADDMLREADIDLDKRVSMKEFQSYAAKNRDVFTVCDAFSVLLNNNPMKRNEKKQAKKQNDNEEDDNENEDQSEDDNVDMERRGGGDSEDEDQVNQFETEEMGDGDEMDPDLYAELQKEKDAEGRTEEQENIKKGIEYGNGMFTEENVNADEFGAVKPWMTNVVNTVPSDYKPSKLDGALPNARLELEYVYGIRVHDTRNNLFYTNSGTLAYHTAAVGIVLNKEENTQNIFVEHFDDITAMAIHPNRKIAVTGEIGPYPLICVWDLEENKPLVTIREPLTKGINHLAFSKDGKYIVASSAADTHDVAIFDWQKGTAEDLSSIVDRRLKVKKGQPQCKGPVVGTCEGGRANILGLCWNNKGDTIAMACVKEVNFITVGTGKLKKKKATGLKGNDLTSIMCCGYLNNTLLCGSMKGKLLVCPGTSFTKSLKAHSAAMNSLFIRDNNVGFITGGADGMVLVWDTKYSITNRLSIKTEDIHSLCPKVRSIDQDPGTGNLLIASRGGEIIEFINGKPNVWMRGHWDLELWGLCVHPNKAEYFTVGEDKLLGVWDATTRKLKQHTVLPEAAKTIDISPNGKELAIGCGNGNFYIYDAITLKQKYKKKEQVTKSVQEVKYSPCGEYLAVGGIDKDTDGFTHIFIFDVKQKYKRIKKMKGHQSRVTHMDWSSDSEFIQSNSQAYELLYHNISSGQQITKISSMRDVEWATNTIVLGWPTQGYWPDMGCSGDDVNAADTDTTRNFAVTSDDFSKVKLFRYPSPVEKAAYLQYNGHSSHVTCVRFTKDNKRVISTGGNDKAIFQWRFFTDADAEEEEEQLMEIDENEANVDDDEQEEYFKEAEDFQGDEFGASRPWLGEMIASSPKTKLDKNAGKAPKEGIKKLSYVFGYRSFDCRQNLKYLKEKNKIIYHTAAVVVELDTKTNKQRFFPYHEEDIVSLALHPNGHTVATGMMAAKGKAKAMDMFVWDSYNIPEETNCDMSDIGNLPDGCTNLKGCHLRAVRILAFSPDGKRLLSGGQDDYNSIAVHDTSNLNKITLIGKSKVDGARVLDAVWKSNDEFITCGPKHMKFWTVKGRNITSQKGVYGKIKTVPLTSCAVAFKKVFTGTDKGAIITWEGANATQSKNICKNGPIYVLSYNDKLKLLFSGGYDGIIIAFDNGKLNEKYRLDIQKITQSICNCGIRAVDIDAEGNNMLVGTRGGEIVEVSLKTHQMNKKLMESHYDTELWGLAVNPANAKQIVTAGGDKTVRIWDIKKNKQLKIMMFPEDMRAVDWSEDGKFIVIGTLNGMIYYIDVDKWEKSSAYKSIFYADEKQKAKQKSDKDKWIQELKISPDMEHVAFGCHCGIGGTFSKIQVLTVTRNIKNPFKTFVTCDPKVTSAITHLDWFEDNDRIVVNSLAFELKFVSCATKKPLAASSCVWEPDLYHTSTCLFGYQVQGIWENMGVTGYSVNYSCQSYNKKVLITGDDNSLLKLFRNPCAVEGAGYKAYHAHSSHIPKVRFTPGDGYVITVGGNDKSVCVWQTDFGADQDEDEEENNENDEEENEENDEDEGNNDEEEGNNEDEENNDEEEGNNEEEEPEPEPEPEPPKKSKAKKKQKQPIIEEEDEKPAKKSVKSPAKSSNKSKKKQIIEEEQEENQEEDQEPSEKPSEKQSKKSKSKKKKNVGFEMAEEDNADQAGNPYSGDINQRANEPWRNSCVLTDHEDGPTSKKPTLSIDLDHVFGLRAKDARNNVKYVNASSIIYQVANLVVVQDIKSDTEKQKFHIGHDNTIVALTVNDDRTLCVTSEGSNPTQTSTVICWDLKEMKEKRRKKFNVDGINALKISPDSSKLLFACLDENHTVYLVDMSNLSTLQTLEGSSKKILSFDFKDNNNFAYVGVKDFNICCYDGQQLTTKAANFPPNADTKIGVICTFQDKYITGSRTGYLYVWKDEKFINEKKLHSAQVDSIFCNKRYIFSCARDSNLCILNEELETIRNISLDAGKITVCPRSIDIFNDSINNILISTVSCDIMELKFNKGYIEGKDYTCKLHTTCHYSSSSNENNQINGIAYLRNKKQFITIGDDGTMRTWDMTKNTMIDVTVFQEDENINQPTAIAVNDDESKIYVGFVDGVIKEFDNGKELTLSKEIHTTSRIYKMKISPDGNYIAIGRGNPENNDDNIFEVIDLTTNKPKCGFNGLQEKVSNIDWTDNSEYVSVTTKGEEIFIYNIPNGNQVSNYEDVKDQKWASWTKEVGWALVGYYDAGEAAITSCEKYHTKANNKNIVVIGDVNGKVKLYNYPIINPNQQCVFPPYSHALSVNNVKFGDAHCVVSSSTDGCLYKWTISSEN